MRELVTAQDRDSTDSPDAYDGHEPKVKETNPMTAPNPENPQPPGRSERPVAQFYSIQIFVSLPVTIASLVVFAVISNHDGRLSGYEIVDFALTLAVIVVMCGVDLWRIQRYRRRLAADERDHLVRNTEPAAAMTTAKENPMHANQQRPDGLTSAEGTAMDHLAAAAEAWARLERQHPQELSEFIAGIHRCQDLLAVRVCRRHYPEGWPVKT